MTTNTTTTALVTAWLNKECPDAILADRLEEIGNMEFAAGLQEIADLEAKAEAGALTMGELGWLWGYKYEMRVLLAVLYGPLP